MDRAEKRKQKQREYYRKNLEQLRAKAKVYRDRWTDEQKRKKRERDLAYYHRTKTLIAHRRKSQRQERTDDQREKEKKKGAQQDRVRQRKTQARLQKILPKAPGGYFKPPKRILPKPLTPDTDETKGIQTETGSQEMGTPAIIGGGLSASARWDVQWQLQRRLDECRRQCQHDVPVHFTVHTVIGEADVQVPPEPFALTRQTLDTLIELL